MLGFGFWVEGMALRVGLLVVAEQWSRPKLLPGSHQVQIQKRV